MLGEVDAGGLIRQLADEIAEWDTASGLSQKLEYVAATMNDRTSVGGALDVLAASPIKLTELRKSLPQDLQQTILVEMTHNEGYAVLRTLAPQASFDDAAKNFLTEAGCETYGSDN